jgi:O-antigen ligase
MMWEKFPFRPNQAHNGYLETYVNLGLIGVFLLVGLLGATYRKARRSLLEDFEWGRFRLGYLCAAIVYNWTEAGFKTVSLVFFLFYIIAIDIPRRRTRSTRAPQPATEQLHDRKRPVFASSEVIMPGGNALQSA